MPDDRSPYNQRIAILPGDPRIAYRPGSVLVEDRGRGALEALAGAPPAPVFDPELSPIGQWHIAHDVADAPSVAEQLVRQGFLAHLDVVYFANGCPDGCAGKACPPHPALATWLAANPWSANPWSANPWSANPWSANPWSANPWSANPWSANPWSANPWSANPEALNIVATGKSPTSSAMPASARALPDRPKVAKKSLVLGVLDSGLAGGPDNADKQRPTLLGTGKASLERISGQLDEPSQPIAGKQADNFLDPVAGHGTFIAGIIEQLTPGCTIRVERVFEPEGDVDVSTLATGLLTLMQHQPQIVNFSFAGTGHAAMFELLVEHYATEHEVVFVGSAGNEGTCVEQFPAALPTVVAVGALGPCGPAPWSNYGCWVNACAPGTDLVSAFFAKFDGALPPINGMDADEFEQWATWSGTSFAAPVVVAALAREIATTGCPATQAVDRVIRAPHLARLPYLGTIVNF
jgi:hypothetical protein